MMPSGIYKRPSIEERFAMAHERGAPDECWLWMKALNPKGYGRMWIENKTITATHVAWFLHHGEWPTQKVLHRCDNPRCVNPAHLFQGTDADNMRDRDDKGRQCKGEHKPQSKLTEDQVRHIRSSTDTGASLARQLGVSQTLIGHVRTRKTWKHV